MSGKPGMKRIATDQNCGRARMWRVIRRRVLFTLDDIVIPLDGVNSNNALKFVQNLVRHGFAKVDGWRGQVGLRGSCKVYRLIDNSGPVQPTHCPRCNQPLTAKTCGGEA